MGHRRGKTRERLDGFSSSMWGERAVARALEVPKAETIGGRCCTDSRPRSSPAHVTRRITALARTVPVEEYAHGDPSVAPAGGIRSRSGTAT